MRPASRAIWEWIHKDHPAKRWRWPQADAVPPRLAVAQRVKRLSSALRQLAIVQAAHAAIVFQRTAVARTAVLTEYAAMARLAIALAIRLQSLSVPLTWHVRAVAVPRSK